MQFEVGQWIVFGRRGKNRPGAHEQQQRKQASVDQGCRSDCPGAGTRGHPIRNRDWLRGQFQGRQFRREELVAEVVVESAPNGWFIESRREKLWFDLWIWNSHTSSFARPLLWTANAIRCLSGTPIR